MAVNNEPRLNVEEQQDDTTFKVTSDIDDSDKGEEITAALKNGCKKLIKEEHNELW